ncbi:MAG: PrgI family protein [bacterium]|nr:PrgI family protein [bacterium]
MQFSVPQFTDIEDRIIAGLSFKQFGIIFASAVITFAVYSITKAIFFTVLTGIVTGVPALALTFGKLNGRPLYASTGNFIRYMFGAKVYVFHKQAHELFYSNSDQPVQVHEATPPKDNKATAVKIKELNYLLQQQASEEATLLTRIQENKNYNNTPQ